MGSQAKHSLRDAEAKAEEVVKRGLSVTLWVLVHITGQVSVPSLTQRVTIGCWVLFTHRKENWCLNMMQLFYKSYNDSKILDVGALQEVEENQTCC